MIKMEISYDIIIKAKDIEKINAFPGLYVFLDGDDNPVYVGRSSDVRLRVMSHLRGGTNTSRICHFFVKVALIYENDKYKRMAAELYLINTFADLLNISGRYRPDLNRLIEYTGRPQVNLCKGITALGKPCHNIRNSNGFCHLHGGNGIHNFDESLLKSQGGTQ